MSHTPKIPGITNGVTTIQSNVSTLQTDVETIETNVATIETNVTTLQSNVSTLQSDVESLKETLNISTRDTETNILSLTPTNPSEQVTIAYGTDTENLYVWNGSTWYRYLNI